MQRLRLLVIGLVVCGSLSAGVAQETRTHDVQVGLSATGARRYRSGRWGVLEARGVNRSDQDRSAVMSVYFFDDARTQYTRRFRIPAGTKRKTWLPIQPPKKIPPGATALDTSLLPIVETESGELLERSSAEPLVRKKVFSLADHNPQTGMIFDLPKDSLDEGNPLDLDVYNLIVEGRLMIMDDRFTVDLSDHFFPPYAQAYEGLDQLVVCSDRVLSDSACLPALRSWAVRGGRVWFMLDRVSPETVRAFLGNALPFEVVDRVELNRFTLNTPDAVNRHQDPLEAWESERAVDFVRVFVDSADVTTLVGEWPAAFSIPFGTGEVYFTTLGPRGWIFQQDPYAEPPTDGRQTSGPTQAYRAFAGNFFQPQHGTLIPKETLQPILETQIGYEVPSRGLAGLLLVANFAAIAGAGAWLARHQRLETMAIAVPVIALLTGLLFISIGRSNAVSVPQSAAVFNHVAVSSDTDEAFTTTVASFYSPDGAELELRHDAFDLVQPESSSDGGATQRAVWGIDHQGRWEGNPIAPGTVKLVQAEDNTALDAPFQARGRFTVDGFAGQLVGAGQIQELSDAVIAREPAPSIAIDITAGNNFLCDEGSVLAVGEYLTGGLLSDEQRRRQDVYRKLLDPAPETPRYPQHPTMLFWGTSKQTKLSVPDGFQVTGSTLYSVPVKIERNPPGEPFLVPSSFIRIDHGGGRFGNSAVYNTRTGEWAEKPLLPTDSWFRFFLPTEVRPCQIDEAVFTVKVHAPSRVVEFGAASNGEKVVVESRQSPSGIIEITVDAPQLLQLQDDGSLIFGVKVGATEQQQQRQEEMQKRVATPRPATPRAGTKAPERDLVADNSTWQIDYMRLRVKGTTQ